MTTDDTASGSEAGGTHESELAPLDDSEQAPGTDVPASHAHAFASDNYAGVHPRVLEAVAEANIGHQVSYGEDDYTRRFEEVMVEHFGEGTHAYPVFNGTGANVIALQSILPRWGAVVCAETAHINVDEGGAPERMGGLKLLPVPTPDGKLTPELIDREAWGWGFEHRAQPLAVSITQTTEVGTAYTIDEIRAIADHVHKKGMKLHLDGARISNAAATLDASMRAFTRDAGVDVVSLGGTKNGIMAGEAVLLFDDETAAGMPYTRKFMMQLASKMRFISAQLVALYENDLWLENARHSNAMAKRLRAGVDELDGVRATQATQSNGVFAVLDPQVADRLRARFRFYDWDASTGEVRWMCSWDTTENDVDAFLAALAEELAR